MQKVILYYNFVPVPDPETTRLWQKELCTGLGLKGRIIIADHGINGTLSGSMKDIKAYVKAMRLHPLFKNTQYKWSDGTGDEFPKLSVKVRPELITLAPDEKFDVYNSTKGLTPKQWHEYIEKNPDVIILDARNDYESDIGVFRGDNLVATEIKVFKQIKETLKDLPKDKPILTYCTGDVRCEYLSAYMKHKGFDEVYHLDGGIVKYGQQFKDDGYWEGKCFVFDQRMSLEFSEDSKDISQCLYCKNLTSHYVNCANNQCNKLILICSKCSKAHKTCSAKKCEKVISIA